jgi:RTX calcium-binding nonapeptide repeat (4 copies)
LLASLVSAVAPAGPALATPNTVAFFNNRAYIDKETSEVGGDESQNMQAGLEDEGYDPRTFTGIGQAALSRALAGARFLVIPELGGDVSLAPDLSQEAVRTIRGYVRTGGGLILVADFQEYLEPLMRKLFGFEPVVQEVGPNSGITPAADGTEFEGGPSSLDDLSAVLGLDSQSLPNGVKKIYKSGGATTVAYFRFGDGEVVVLGWDWYDAQPLGTQDGGWLEVLGRTSSQVEGRGCNVLGTVGPNDLAGTDRRDRICAFAGADVVRAKDGNDRLILGRGDDRGFGGAGDDDFRGGPGDDACVQGPGSGTKNSC